MAKKRKCPKNCKKRRVGRPKGSKNKKRRKKKGGALPALAVGAAKILAPILIKEAVSRLTKRKRGGGMRLM